MQSTSPKFLPASVLAFNTVKNPGGEHLGRIEDLMIDPATGRVAYAVLSFGGLMGLGSKYFAVPWKSLTLDRENAAFLLNTSRHALEYAPGFDKEDWPELMNGKRLDDWPGFRNGGLPNGNSGPDAYVSSF